MADMFFDITLHKMACSQGDFSSLYEISHVNGQIISTFKRVNHHKRGTEIFIKHLMPDILLQEILEFVFPMGQVYQIRILLEFSGHCRGYCYVNFFEVESARKAMMVLCGKTLRNVALVVKMSFDNNRLEIANIPSQRTAEEVFREISKKIGTGLQEIFFTHSKDNEDRSNCILIYNTHKNALEARKQVFEGFDLFGEKARIDWAIPEEKIKSKRLYFEVPLPKLKKPELYEEIIKVIKPKRILNIFLQNGIGYITFENESVAYESFKLLQTMRMFGYYFKFSFRKLYNRLPNAGSASSSEISESSDVQLPEGAVSDVLASLQLDSMGSSEISGYSSLSSNESNNMPTVFTQANQQTLMLRTVPNLPMPAISGVPQIQLPQIQLPQIQFPQIPNHGISLNAPEHFQICGVPYSPSFDCLASPVRQNQFVDHPIRIIQLNSNIHNNIPVNFYQMTQEFYKQFQHQ